MKIRMQDVVVETGVVAELSGLGKDGALVLTKQGCFLLHETSDGALLVEDKTRRVVVSDGWVSVVDLRQAEQAPSAGDEL